MTANPKPPPPIRDKAHLRFVSGLPCCIPVCGRPSGPPHHLLRGSDKCAGRKAGDNFALPMCPEHHTALHLNGDEPWFLDWHGVHDGHALAAALWDASGDYELACAILRGMQATERRI